LNNQTPFKWGSNDMNTKIPVILDTDIGSDIDDTWALGFLINCPELDLKAVICSSGDTRYRAKLVAKFLTIAGHDSIPIGIGTSFHDNEGPQRAWVKSYDLGSYKGGIVENGADLFIDTIMKSKENAGSGGNTKVIAIGPLTTVAEALRKQPKISLKASFVGMHGSVYKGYGGSEKPSPEYNVVQDIEACRTVFHAPWNKTLAPLDTCGTIMLEGQDYQSIVKAKTPLPKMIIENYRLWSIGSNEWAKIFNKKYKRYQVQSSVLFDTLAVYLAFSEQYVTIEEVPLKVTDKGDTQSDATGEICRCAVGWKNKDAFLRLLVERLTKE
jgi:inosine-uridine nucleoside N-ribohydrolase